MDKRGAKKILDNNLEVLKDMSQGKYWETLPNVCHYLLSNHQKLLQVIRKLYQFLYTRKRYITDGGDERHCYYFNDSRRFAYGISNASVSVAQGYREILSAIGMLCRVDMAEDLILNNNQKKGLMVTYIFEEWDDAKLEEFEENATRMRTAGVTKSNISSAYLLLHGLEDMKDRILPFNNADGVIYAKNRLLERFNDVVDDLIDSQGYATNDQIADQMRMSQKSFDNFRRLFRDRITAEYNFHRPTSAEISQFGLTSKSYIYTLKSGATK